MELPSVTKKLLDKEELLDDTIIEKIFKYLRTHVFELRIPNRSIEDLENEGI